MKSLDPCNEEIGIGCLSELVSLLTEDWSSLVIHRPAAFIIRTLGRILSGVEEEKEEVILLPNNSSLTSHVENKFNRRSTGSVASKKEAQRDKDGRSKVVERRFLKGKGSSVAERKFDATSP